MSFLLKKITLGKNIITCYLLGKNKKSGYQPTPACLKNSFDIFLLK
jgi:hypothetical protein